MPSIRFTSPLNRVWDWLAFGLLVSLAPAGAAFASGASPGGLAHEGHSHHAHHTEHGAAAQSYVRSLRDVQIPDLSLLTRDGRPVSLRAELESDEPLLLNFIFTSCTSICPVLTATFSATRKQLQSEGDAFRLVSITIDPEHDTPARLAEFAKRHRVDSEWRFLTGSQAAITRVQKAFDVYRGNKMNHVPVTFVRRSSNAEWVRIEGFPAAADLVREVQEPIR